MTALIYRYNLNLKFYEDSRTIAEVKAEIDVEPDIWNNVMSKLLSGDVVHVQNTDDGTNVIYSLSMDAVTNYLIKLAGKKTV